MGRKAWDESKQPQPPVDPVGGGAGGPAGGRRGRAQRHAAMQHTQQNIKDARMHERPLLVQTRRALHLKPQPLLRGLRALWAQREQMLCSAAMAEL